MEGRHELVDLGALLRHRVPLAHRDGVVIEGVEVDRDTQWRAHLVLAPIATPDRSGDVDMVLMDKTSAAGYMGASPNSFKIIGEPLGTEEFGFIFKPGSDRFDRRPS